ncbi:ABC transporter permease [Streptomyces montanisoli]|uniref:ABC transporter permease n=1 Tax=Streptomyces montanisoli TaxID=2798581 RepID=A0A940MKX5_9ACTN|nr:ABC transporter permease [Streptomyces montanisoli]MBP0462020.1 ABC transporter permease [Streptomyces montanisoli]
MTTASTPDFPLGRPDGPAPDARTPQGADGGRTAGRGAFAGYLVYVAGKAGGALVSLGAVLVTSFFLFRVLSRDPVKAMTHGAPMTVAQQDALRHQFGLDLPLWRQFTGYCGQALTGDLGTSYQFHAPVSELIWQKLPATLLLTGTAVVLYSALGLWLGTRAAWRSGGRGDRVNTGLALTLWSVPSFWLGLLLIIVFGVGLGPVPGMFPTGGMSSGDTTGFAHVLDVAHHMVLPVLTLVAVGYAQTLLVMRSSLLDEMGGDYLTTARAKGLREAVVRRRHAVPNALLPTVTMVFINLGFVAAGSILTETVFSWPGLGRLFYQALSVPDLPLVQGLFMVFAAAMILMNLLADLLYPFLDPRVGR